jgi:hypothetical protein
VRLTVLIPAALLTAVLAAPVPAAEVESRVLTHYVPQDFLEVVVRKEAWMDLPLEVKGGVRKGDVVRVWAGGSIDRGNGEQPGENTGGPTGGTGTGPFALSATQDHAFALLFRTEDGGVRKCPAAGKALEIKLTKDGQRLQIGFNDQRGRYADNHIGKGRRHEFDPLWVRVEVVRITVD